MWGDNIYCKQFSLAFLSPSNEVKYETLDAHSRATHTRVCISASIEMQDWNCVTELGAMVLFSCLLPSSHIRIESRRPSLSHPSSSLHFVLSRDTVWNAAAYILGQDQTQQTAEQSITDVVLTLTMLLDSSWSVLMLVKRAAPVSRCL